MTAALVPPTDVDAPTARAPLDLLLGWADLGQLLTASLEAEQWLDAFLASAGLTQILEDHLHPDPWQLHRAARFLALRPGRVARQAGRVFGAAGHALVAVGGGADRRHGIALRHDLADLTITLAQRVFEPPSRASRVRLPQLDSSPDLQAEILRIPACFRSFDQHPDDALWLVHELRRQVSGRPVCVVGVRTSGSYLAPLHAAAWRLSGVGADQLTVRPGRPLLPFEIEQIRRHAADGALFVVVDDPPGSGRSLAEAVRALTRIGVRTDDVVLALSLFTDGLPGPLRGLAAVTQSWPNWSIHQRLSPPRVMAALSGLIGPEFLVEDVRRLWGGSMDPARAHTAARFAVTARARAGGGTMRIEVMAEGCGIGFFGQQAARIMRALPEYLPPVYGARDGLLLRTWVGESGPGVDGRPPLIPSAEAVAGYLLQRQQTLSVARDPTRLMRGRDPDWEVAAAILARPFGPAAPAARLTVLEPLTRRLLKASRPCLTDGRMAVEEWVCDSEAPHGAWKTAAHHGAFSNVEHASYDIVADLAGAFVGAPSRAAALATRAAFEQSAGPVDEERWLLHQLVQLHLAGALGTLDVATVQRLSAGAVHRYLARCLLDDLEPAHGDRVVALDLDGVLETDCFAFRASTPGGVLALRALRAHGFLPVLATGRSLGEVTDRCADLGLAGGVAEYGAVVYRSADRSVHDQRDGRSRTHVDEARAALRALGVEVDPAYRYSLRARVRHGPVPTAMLADSRVPADAMRTIHGEDQTDLVAATVDKASGLRSLLGLLGADRLCMAVGDTAADLPMLAMAEAAFAPGNADRVLRASRVPVTRRAYQRGLLEACGRLIGHRPGGCPRCRLPDMSADRRALLAALAVPERGALRMPFDALQMRGWLP